MVEPEVIKKTKEKDETKIRCSVKFLRILKDYQKKFYEKHNVFPSIAEVTDIVATKIENVGGLKV